MPPQTSPGLGDAGAVQDDENLAQAQVSSDDCRTSRGLTRPQTSPSDSTDRGTEGTGNMMLEGQENESSKFLDPVAE